MTGFYRDGYCNTGEDDNGTHVVCAKATNKFLKFTKSRGNDLITKSNYFPGLVQGDEWCFCALRIKEAIDNGVDDLKIIPESSNIKTLEFLTNKDLRKLNIEDSKLPNKN